MTVAAAGLTTHVWNNNLRSIALLVSYPLVIIAIVWAIAFAYGWTAHYGAGTESLAAGAVTGNLIVAKYWPAVTSVVLVWFVIAWFSHTSMIRRLSHSHPVSRIEEPELYNLVENLCISRGITMPRIEIIETHARNAFASGIDRGSYTITVTRGLLNSLTRDEVEAVLAHELTHIINRDVRLLIVSIIFTGMIGMATQIVSRSLLHRSPRGSRHSGSSALMMLVVLGILSIGYLATLLTRFALSRGREYMADAGAVSMTKNPEAMMSALLRISRHERVPGATEDIAMMYTHNSKPFLGVFATHPPIEDRVRTISELTGTPVPEIRTAPAGPADSFGNPERHPPNPWIRRAG